MGVVVPMRPDNDLPPCKACGVGAFVLGPPDEDGVCRFVCAGCGAVQEPEVRP